MNTEVRSLYDVLGGQPVMEAVVEAFYQRVLADPRINRYFAHTNMDMLRKHQAAFIGMVLGSPHPYAGRNMSEAHRGLHLSKADFDAVTGHLVATLESFSLPQVHIDTIVGKVAALEREVLHQ